jgi:hypothetical protein
MLEFAPGRVQAALLSQAANLLAEQDRCIDGLRRFRETNTPVFLSYTPDDAVVALPDADLELFDPALTHAIERTGPPNPYSDEDTARSAFQLHADLRDSEETASQFANAIDMVLRQILIRGDGTHISELR